MPCLLRLNAGSCNGCDVELAITACVPRYDVAQLGCCFTEDPREADVVLVTGPVTRGLREPIAEAWRQVPEPRVAVAVGACPISCGAFRGSEAVEGPLDRVLPVGVNVPGCPPRPQAILEGVAKAIALWRERSRGASRRPPAPRSVARRSSKASAAPGRADATPGGLRGRLRFDAAACVACRMCEYVCASGAIGLEELAEGVRLTVHHASCVFCGLCAQHCPTGALEASADWHLAHLAADADHLADSGVVERVPCAACGAPLIPLRRALARRVWRAVSPDMERLQGLCPPCRARASAERLAR